MTKRRRLLRGVLIAHCAASLLTFRSAIAAAASDQPTGSAAKPNVLIILADDMGFADAGCYGGEIQTPHLDQLAKNGLRFTQFYNTGRCWPTRACLMSGYYAQQVRMDPPRGRLPAWAKLLPRYLRPQGYRCYHVGKWHVLGAPLPVADGGFDRSYWFEDWDRYFSPVKHFQDDQLLPPVKPDSGYYATTAFADQAIRFLEDHAANHAEQPFCLYLAFISPHFPLHALEKDIARYRGAYSAGWDVVRAERYRRLTELGLVNCALAPREPAFAPRYFKPEFLATLGAGEIDRAAAWNDLTDEQRAFQADKMALHAAMITRMDEEIGRVVETLRASRSLDDTLILFLSDNGTDATILVRGEGHDPSAAPGSWRSFLCLGPGWSSAGNTPFRRHKVWVHEGGISTPLIAHWPNGISARGELRNSPGHVIDIVPTVLELAGATPPAVADRGNCPPLPGRSLLPLFQQDLALDREFLFFHHEGNRALRRGKWKIVSAREDGDRWELYDLSKDRCEQRDLAGQFPDQLQEMVDFWQAREKEFRAQAGDP